MGQRALLTSRIARRNQTKTKCARAEFTDYFAAGLLRGACWHDSPPGCAARQRARTGQPIAWRKDEIELKMRAACSHLILRSRAQRGVSKDGDALRCSPPFET